MKNVLIAIVAALFLFATTGLASAQHHGGHYGHGYFHGGHHGYAHGGYGHYAPYAAPYSYFASPYGTSYYGHSHQWHHFHH